MTILDLSNMSLSPDTQVERSSKKQKRSLAVDIFYGSESSQTNSDSISQSTANGSDALQQEVMDSIDTVDIVPDGDVLLELNGLAGVKKP